MIEDSKRTITARKRYDRIAPLYDLMEGLVERTKYSRWRRLLWSKVEGENVLEIGVGTGKNFAYYPLGVRITAIDFSEKMLMRACDKAKRENVNVNLQQMDVQSLEFADETFDTVVGSFVFCSVPDPVHGLEILFLAGDTILSGRVINLKHGCSIAIRQRERDTKKRGYLEE